MGSITRFALDNSRLVILFVIMIVVAGISTYLSYPRKEDPTIVVREAIVTAAYPGMAPGRVESLITEPLEQAIRELPEVDEIRSDSKTGVSVIHVKIADEYFDLPPIWQDLRNKVSDAVTELPDGVRGPFVNDEVGLTAVATVALWADGFSMPEMFEVAKDLRRDLYTLDGVSKVELYGVQPERIYLEMSTAKLSQLGISPALVADTLRQQNVILPGGKLEADGREIVIEPSGSFEDLEAIAEVQIAAGEGGTVRLRDIASLSRRVVDPPDRPVYFNGREAIILSVSIAEGINSVEFGERLSRRLDRLQTGLPVGYVLEYATYQPELVEVAVNGAVSNVVQTLVIVLLVVMAFLGARTGLIVGAIVPLSMLLALIVMSVIGVELERISIAAMIIALGLLVDNGIVVAEDIRQRLEQGQERRQACLEAGRSLATPLLTSSLTTILAFLPMLLAVGPAGEYTGSLSQVIIVVLLGSWLLAMFVTPSLCYRFLVVPATDASEAAAETGYRRAYRRALGWLLDRRGAFLALMAIALVSAGLLFQRVDQAFFPASERNQLLVYIDLPAGSSVRQTEALVQRFSGWLSDAEANPEVASSVAYVGDGGPRFYLSLAPIDPDPHIAFAVVTTETPADVAPLLERIRSKFLADFPEARARAKAMWLGSVESGLVAYRIIGTDADALAEAAGRLGRAMDQIPGTLDVRQDWENRTLKVRLAVDQTRARRAGITSEEIARSVNTYLSGAEVTDYREGDLAIPLVLRGQSDERRRLASLQSLEVYSPSSGAHVPLPQVASFEPEFELSRIRRYDQERTVTVEGKHRTLKAGQLADRLAPALAEIQSDLPPGHRIEVGGELEGSAEARERLFANMPLALAIILILLVWQFNSFRRPLIIALTIPLSFIGAVIGLLVMDATFGFMAILGLFSLAGIIINNGIVLIDRIDANRAEGQDPREAIINAASARLRPIVMTTVTTILGLVPLIIFGGALWYGLANVIAWGLLVGTLLTLGLVPVLYSLLFRVGRAERRAAAGAVA